MCWQMAWKDAKIHYCTVRVPELCNNYIALHKSDQVGQYPLKYVS
jgi:hypothetical protein